MEYEKLSMGSLIYIVKIFEEKLGQAVRRDLCGEGQHDKEFSF